MAFLHSFNSYTVEGLLMSCTCCGSQCSLCSHCLQVTFDLILLSIIYSAFDVGLINANGHFN